MIIFAKYGEYDRRELLEECLTKYLETMKKTKLEGELTELKNHNDKPYFKDYPDVRFSISHSGALVVVAMAQTEVGIDIEEFRPRAYQKVVENVFTKGEAKEVKDLETFLAVWTRKEAYAKAYGKGLAMDFKEFDTLQEKGFYSVRLRKDCWLSVYSVEQQEQIPAVVEEDICMMN